TEGHDHVRSRVEARVDVPPRPAIPTPTLPRHGDRLPSALRAPTIQDHLDTWLGEPFAQIVVQVTMLSGHDDQLAGHRCLVPPLPAGPPESRRYPSSSRCERFSCLGVE